jgi:hypothetical protein
MPETQEPKNLDDLLAEDPPPAQWKVVFDGEGVPHTQCPHCGVLDQIREVDEAVRWNTLHLADDGKTATASIDNGSADWEFDTWICLGPGCLKQSLEPEGFEITEWN